jgi:hypothetical protein
VLDFRFLIGTVLAGVVLVMTALLIFSPILATRPPLETAVVPRALPVTEIAKAPNTPASKRAPQKSSPPIAAVPIIPKPPASIRNAPVSVPASPPQLASTPRVPSPEMPASSSPGPAVAEQAAVPLPSPKPDAPEVTGSVDPAAQAADVPAKREPETPEFGELNLFRLFFPQAAGQKQSQGANRPTAFPPPFTQ